MSMVSKKARIALIAVALLLINLVGSSVAYMLDKTSKVSNTFEPAEVSCAVVENGNEYTAHTVNVSSKSNVSIKNTGNVPAYIRAAILVTWKSENGTVYAMKPEMGTEKDYTLQLNYNDWFEEGGFYYYKSAVSVDSLTSNLITSATQIKEGPVGLNNTQYYLSIEILSEAIQADGMGVDSVQQAWAAVRND